MEQIHLAFIVLGAFAGWTVTVVGATYWLAGRFRALEITFYKALNKHVLEDADEFEQHKLRIQQLENKVFGWTRAP